MRQVSQVPMLLIGEAGPECFVPLSLGNDVSEIQSAREWECEYCGRVNQGNWLECTGCGGPKVAKVSEGLLLLQGISAAQWASDARADRERVYFGSQVWG